MQGTYPNADAVSWEIKPAQQLDLRRKKEI
jgi:hypothetical protein